MRLIVNPVRVARSWGPQNRRIPPEGREQRRILGNVRARTRTGFSVIPTLLILAALAVLVILAVLNRQTLLDTFTAMQYQPTAEITSVESKLQLTDAGQKIFRASHPALASQSEFNQDCESHSVEVSILGCYRAGTIYVYNIDEPELDGIIESTFAHELLHAVWERLESGERSELADLLNEVYLSTQYHRVLADDLETYPAADQIDELHSRIGTQVKALPEKLERHYAKYFKDQDDIVDFYENYSEPFHALEAEISGLEDRLADLKQEIDTKTDNYYERSEKLSAEIDEFNTCAGTEGCFRSTADFTSHRTALVSEQSALEDLYYEVDRLINDYNSLVAEYNNNVLRSQNLENAINSNVLKEEI